MLFRADLHVHSTFSDGSDSIERLVGIAKNKGLDAIAITDHDTLSHAARIPSNAGIIVLAGIEISAIHRATGIKVHILGYQIQKPEIVTALTQPHLEARSKNSERQADILISHGFMVDVGKLARADGKYLYKQHILDWLVSTGQAPEMFGEFYQKTFKRGGICAFDIEYVDVFEAVKAIKEAGGLAVLAHPGQQQNFGFIPELVGLGLDGLELNHHSHSDNDKVAVRNYADRYNLFLTGGSDYHGRYESYSVGIGDFLSHESGAAAICCL